MSDFGYTHDGTPAPAVMWIMPVGVEKVARNDRNEIVYSDGDGLGTAEPMDVTVRGFETHKPHYHTGEQHD